jgi:hypothetical protein
VYVSYNAETPNAEYLFLSSIVFMDVSTSSPTHLTSCPLFFYINTGQPATGLHSKLTEISGSHGGEYENGCLTGCCAV